MQNHQRVASSFCETVSSAGAGARLKAVPDSTANKNKILMKAKSSFIARLKQNSKI